MAKELLKLNVRWRVGNGEKIRPFEDPWLLRLGLFKIVSPASSTIEAVSELINPNGTWDYMLLDTLFVHIDNKQTSEDTLVWHFEKSGCYFMKSGYWLGMRDRFGDTNCSSNHLKKWWKNLWLLNVPLKIKVFIWGLYHNTIPLGRNLSASHMQVTSSCCICGCVEETTWHAFFECSVAKNV